MRAGSKQSGRQEVESQRETCADSACERRGVGNGRRQRGASSGGALADSPDDVVRQDGASNREERLVVDRAGHQLHWPSRCARQPPCQSTLLRGTLRARKNFWRRERLSVRCNTDAEGIAGMSAGFPARNFSAAGTSIAQAPETHIVRCGSVMGDMTGAHGDARPWRGVKTHLLAARPPS